jgi:hypothetical protein
VGICIRKVETSRKMRKAPATAGTAPRNGRTKKEFDMPNITPAVPLSDDPRGLASVPTKLLAMTAREPVDQLLRRGGSIEQLCSELGSSPKELAALLAAADKEAGTD